MQRLGLNILYFLEIKQGKNAKLVEKMERLTIIGLQKEQIIFEYFNLYICKECFTDDAKEIINISKIDIYKIN